MAWMTQKFERAHSLPPNNYQNLRHYDCLANNVYTQNSKFSIPSEAYLQNNSELENNISEIKIPNLIQIKDQINNQIKTQSHTTENDLSLHETDENLNSLTRQCTGLSPSGSSVNTDEDSGYGRNPLNDSKLSNSSCSQSNPVTLNLDESGSIGITNRDELLLVMVEDLVDWFLKMYPNLVEGLSIDNFFDKISDGVLLCHHANELHNRLETSPCFNPADKYRKLSDLRINGIQALLPLNAPIYQRRGLNLSNASASFVSRNNISNFLSWCRQLGMRDSILFESEDLVSRKNLRNVVVCLLELARLGGNVGLQIPELVKLEVEIDQVLATDDLFLNDWKHLHKQEQLCDQSDDSINNSNDYYKHDNSFQNNNHTRNDQFFEGGGEEQVEYDFLHENPTGNNIRKSTNNQSQNYRLNRCTSLRNQQQQQINKKLTNDKYLKLENRSDIIENKNRKPEYQRPVIDLRSLDDLVRELLSECKCKQTFPMIRIGEGRYLFGDKSVQIFVRILRNHVMVRVGGGWDTLSHFLTKYDECRKVNPVQNCQLNMQEEKNLEILNIDNKDNLIEAIKHSNPHQNEIRSDNVSTNMNELGGMMEGQLNVIKKHKQNNFNNCESQNTTLINRSASCKSCSNISNKINLLENTSSSLEMENGLSQFDYEKLNSSNEKLNLIQPIEPLNNSTKPDAIVQQLNKKLKDLNFKTAKINNKNSNINKLNRMINNSVSQPLSPLCNRKNYQSVTSVYKHLNNVKQTKEQSINSNFNKMPKNYSSLSKSLNSLNKEKTFSKNSKVYNISNNSTNNNSNNNNSVQENMKKYSQPFLNTSSTFKSKISTAAHNNNNNNNKGNHIINRPQTSPKIKISANKLRSHSFSTNKLDRIEEQMLDNLAYEKSTFSSQSKSSNMNSFLNNNSPDNKNNNHRSESVNSTTRRRSLIPILSNTTTAVRSQSNPRIQSKSQKLTQTTKVPF